MSEQEKIVYYLKKERDRQRQLKIKHSNIPDHYFGFGWDNYRTDHDHSKLITDREVVESRELAKAICQTYAKSIDTIEGQGKSLFLFGKRSSGKTVLATLILREAIKQLSSSVYYIRFSQFAVEANTANLNDEREIFEDRYQEPSFLCIDEIEKLDSTPKIRNYLGSLLLYRQQNKKPTILTSKLTLDQIRYFYGEMVHSVVTDPTCYFPPIIIKTEESIKEFSVKIEPGRKYSIKTLRQFLNEKLIANETRMRNMGKPKVQAEREADYIDSEELSKYIVRSEKRHGN